VAARRAARHRQLPRGPPARRGLRRPRSRPVRAGRTRRAAPAAGDGTVPGGDARGRGESRPSRRGLRRRGLPARCPRVVDAALLRARGRQGARRRLSRLAGGRARGDNRRAGPGAGRLHRTARPAACARRVGSRRAGADRAAARRQGGRAVPGREGARRPGRRPHSRRGQRARGRQPDLRRHLQGRRGTRRRLRRARRRAWRAGRRLLRLRRHRGPGGPGADAGRHPGSAVRRLLVGLDHRSRPPRGHRPPVNPPPRRAPPSALRPCHVPSVCPEHAGHAPAAQRPRLGGQCRRGDHHHRGGQEGERFPVRPHRDRRTGPGEHG
jgi:hypothetical protein